MQLLFDNISMKITWSVMEPKVKRVKFNFNSETVVIPCSDYDSDSDTEGSATKSVASQKIIVRRNSVDREDESSKGIGKILSTDLNEEEGDDDDVIAIEVDTGAAADRAEKDKRAQSIADENEWLEKYKKSCQQYTFINPLPHGKREETFPCRFRLEGCSYASDSIRTAVHVHSCDYRPVICTASEECGQVLFTKYLDHIRIKHDATGMVSNRRWWHYEQFIVGDTPLGQIRLPIYIRKYDEQTFLLNTQIIQSKIHWWVTMHGELEKIANYCVSLRVLPRVDKKCDSDVLRSSDLDVYLSRQVTLNNVPASNFSVAWEELADYIYSKSNCLKETFWRIKVTIRRKKPKPNLTLMALAKELRLGTTFKY